MDTTASASMSDWIDAGDAHKVAFRNEAEFVTWIINVAQGYGWLVCHFRPARTSKGYRTALQGYPGFPDIVLARKGVVLFIEAKMERGKLSVYQKRWIEELDPTYHLSCHSVRVVRPSDMATIEEILT